MSKTVEELKKEFFSDDIYPEESNSTKGYVMDELEFDSLIEAVQREKLTRLIFKNKEGKEIHLDVTSKQLLENSIDDFYELLEPECSSSSCYTESNNHCDCQPIYEGYEFNRIANSLKEAVRSEERERFSGLPEPDDIDFIRMIKIILNGSDSGIKTYFKNYLCRAIEQASNQDKILEEKFDNDLSAEAMGLWQKEIQEAWDFIIDWDLADFRELSSQLEQETPTSNKEGE